MIAGRFQGLAAAYNVVALSQELDLIEQGAFDQAFEPQVDYPLFMYHELTRTIGTVRFSKSNRGLEADGSLVDTTEGLDAWKLIEAGATRALSIGFLVPRSGSRLVDTKEYGPVRYISKLTLKELTILPNGFAADSTARIEKIFSVTQPIVQPVQPAAIAQPKAPVVPAPALRDAYTQQAVRQMIEMHERLSDMYSRDSEMSRIRREFDRMQRR